MDRYQPAEKRRKIIPFARVEIYDVCQVKNDSLWGVTRSLQAVQRRG